MDILNVLGCGWLLGQVALGDADGADELYVEVLAQDDVVLETRLYLEVLVVFLIDITKLQHTICYFLVEQGYLLLYTVPYADLPLGVVLLLLLEMCHKL